MSEKKPSQTKAGFEANLDGLLGAFGEKLGEVFARLEALDGLEVTKDFKVSAAVRGGAQSAQTRKSRAPKPESKMPEKTHLGELDLDLEVTANRVFVTAEVSGVTLSAISVALVGPTLTVQTPAAKGQAALPITVRGDDMSVALRNGILTIEIGCDP